MKIKLLLFCSAIIIIFCYFYKLGEVPFGFFCDEASIGYNAYSLLTTGKDEFGKNWPLFYQAFGEFKNPVMLYSTIPFVGIFGLNEFAVRFPSLIYGLLTIIAVYFLGKEIASRKLGLISGVILAITPWHYHFSRINFEGLMPFVFFTTLGTYFWIRFWKNSSKIIILILSIIFFSFALYSYFPARIFIPLYAICLVFLQIKTLVKNLKIVLVVGLFSLILAFPLINHMISGEGFSRLNQMKIDYSPKRIATLYLNHFSLDYLFIKGDIDFPGEFITRHSIRGFGQLQLITLPLSFFGIVYLVKKRFKGNLMILPVWFLLYPISTIFSDTSIPIATRSIIGEIPFVILAALGYVFITELKHCVKIVGFILFPIFIFSFLTMYYSYQNKYVLYSSDYWGFQSGAKEIMKYFIQNRFKYDELYLSGDFNSPPIFLKFYDPEHRCNNCFIGGTDRLDPFKKQLFAIRVSTYNNLVNTKSFLIQKTIYLPNKNPEFYIGEFIK
jgi:4-amino-4-deoxy-L-arabinose transferase-like glycosyltransferase